MAVFGGHEASFSADAIYFPVFCPNHNIAPSSLNSVNIVTRCKFGDSLMAASKSTVLSPTQQSGHFCSHFTFTLTNCYIQIWHELLGGLILCSCLLILKHLYQWIALLCTEDSIITGTFT